MADRAARMLSPDASSTYDHGDVPAWSARVAGRRISLYTRRLNKRSVARNVLVMAEARVHEARIYVERPGRAVVMLGCQPRQARHDQAGSRCEAVFPWRSPILALLLACHRAPEPPVAPSPATPPLVGRRAGELSCPGYTPAHRHEGSCDGVDLDPPPGDGRIMLDPPEVPAYGDESYARRQRARKCRHDRIRVCGVALLGPAGSYALTCRDAQGAITGARLVAPDGSVIAEGACERSSATGAWIWWSEGRIETVRGYQDGLGTGLYLQRRDTAYESGFLPSRRPGNGPQ